MLEQVLAEIHNDFVHARYRGAWAVEDGGIALPFLAPGQYFRIRGSRLNDGVHRYPAEGLSDERFEGEIWELRVPRAVVALAAEIEAWQQKYGAAAGGPYKAESFGGYSYTRAGDGGWRKAFRGRLKAWRKLAPTDARA